jgi:hypothetical protein
VTVSADESVSVDAGRLLEWYEQMALIRRTEKAAYDLFMSGEVKGTTHLAAGQEAVAVGASAALREDDYVFATYRGHHHAIARGATPAECLAELMSKATGLCAAKGGSMHLTKADKGMLGSYAIVGSHLPIAAGAAWSAKLRGTDQVAVAFFGDGATNIGAFHEALNLAAVWKLPVLRDAWHPQRVEIDLKEPGPDHEHCMREQATQVPDADDLVQPRPESVQGERHRSSHHGHAEGCSPDHPGLAGEHPHPISGGDPGEHDSDVEDHRSRSDTASARMA